MLQIQVLRLTIVCVIKCLYVCIFLYVCIYGNTCLLYSCCVTWIVVGDLQQYSCEFGSGKYFALCGFGGILSCGTTHTAVVPLDLVKCRIQVDPAKYGGIIKGFRVSLAEAGVRELGKGWAPTFFGYSMQGLGKFGLYEVFKIYYSMAIGEVNLTLHTYSFC